MRKLIALTAIVSLVAVLSGCKPEEAKPGPETTPPAATSPAKAGAGTTGGGMPKPGDSGLDATK